MSDLIKRLEGADTEDLHDHAAVQLGQLLGDAVDALRAAEADCKKLRAQNEALRELLRAWMRSGCPICGGDCASANPPVSQCPIRKTRAALQDEQAAP